MGAGGTAATVVLSSTGMYDKQMGVNYKWSQMVRWTEIKDVAMKHPNATKLLGDINGKRGAKGKKAEKVHRMKRTRTSSPAA